MSLKMLRLPRKLVSSADQFIWFSCAVLERLGSFVHLLGHAVISALVSNKLYVANNCVTEMAS